MLQVVLALAFAGVAQQQLEVSFSYLGIDGTDAAKRKGVVVVELDEHSPAEAAGIRVGDVILTLDGQPVRSFESLLTAVEQRAPGQIVSISFQREAESGRVMVELGDLRPMCEEGNALTCSFLAARYYNADYEGEARRLATLFYEKACGLGYLQACNSLGVMHRFGSGVSKDLSRAAVLFERACNADLGHACLSLAEAYSDGEGVEKNPARALELFERSCALDTNYACFSLGLMYELALDVPQDWLAAAEYYRGGCEFGWDSSCEHEWHVSRRSPSDEEEPKTFPDATPELNAALVDAIREGEVDDVRRLLAEGADPTTRGDYGSMRELRLVKLAIYKEQPEIVRMLIDAGVGIEDKDRMNTATPLTAAIGQSPHRAHRPWCAPTKSVRF